MVSVLTLVPGVKAWTLSSRLGMPASSMFAPESVLSAPDKRTAPPPKR
jgi:hypothetical protein